MQAALLTKKPTSSVEAGITGCSTFGSHARPKQETSTASSKNYTFKTGIFAFITAAFFKKIVLLLLFHRLP
jgi:hypothetical protein